MPHPHALIKQLEFCSGAFLELCLMIEIEVPRSIPVKHGWLIQLLLVCSMLTATVWPISAQAQGICDRTPQVQTTLMARTNEENCADVTTERLSYIRGRLDLGNSRLTSLISGDFDGLTNLTELRLHNNSITSLPPDIFDGLTSLISLNLYNNSITVLPEDVFGGLTRLKALSLNSNSMTSLPPDVFDGLTNLTSLNLYNNRMTALPEDVFDGLTSLTSLYLNSNNIASLLPDVFDGLTSLTELRLSHNSITSLPEDIFDDLTSLTQLELNNNSIDALPRDTFGGLTSLTTLRLSNNPNATSPATFLIPYELVRTDDGGTDIPATVQVRLPPYVPASLRSQTATLVATDGVLAVAGGTPAASVTVALDTDVTVIATGDPAVTVSAVAVAPDKQTASRGMVVSDASPIRIALTDLCDRTPQVRDAILAKLPGVDDCFVVTKTQLNELAGRLDLSDTGLRSLQDRDFAGLTGLERLVLAQNSITSLPKDIFNGLTGLRVLALYENSITSLPEDVFDGLTSLVTLDLSNNSITSLPEDVFDGLTSLTFLFLPGNSMTSLPEDIFDAPTGLTFLYLDNNNIASLPSGVFDGLTSLVFLWLQNNNLDSFPTDALSALPSLGTGDDGVLRIENNPEVGSPPFSIPYELVRTGGGADGPAAIQVRLPVYAPAELRSQTVSLSATGGTLAVGQTPAAASVTVDLDTDVTVVSTGNSAVIVSTTAPSGQSATNGMVVGEAKSLTLNLNARPTGAPAITRTDTGTPVTGQTLTVARGTLDDPNGLPTPFVATAYQWQRSTSKNFTNSRNIRNATRSSHSLTADDAGTYIRVKVSFTDGATNPEIVASSPLRIAATDLCDRTPQVRDAILGKISGVNDCFIATAAQLNELAGTLNFGNAKLTSLLPNDFAGLASLTELDLNGNSITSLPEGVFDGLTKLERLALNGNSMDSLLEDAFDGLTSLTQLDLSNNSMDSLLEDAFDGLTSLTQLDLNDNSITSLPEDIFDGLTSLTELNLNDNSIASLPKDVFDGLTSLTLLRLHNNNIDVFPTEALSTLPILGTGDEGELRIENNPSLNSPPFSIPYELVRTDGRARVARPLYRCAYLSTCPPSYVTRRRAFLPPMGLWQ